MASSSPGPSGSAPRRATVGAVVVNKDAGPALLECVTSLRAAGVADVVVVDNDSSDGSLADLARADRDVQLLPTGANLGYGRGANVGAARLDSDYLLVSNPDVVVDPDAVRRLVAALEVAPDIALVGPRLTYPDGGIYPSARAFPSLPTAAAHAFLGLFWPSNSWSRRYRLEQGDAPTGPVASAACDVDWVSGACFLVRRVAFDSVGGFDTAYFMYVEDLDLCWRLHRAGWRVRFDPGAIVVHDQGLSSGAHPYRMLMAHHRSTWRFACRSASGAERPALPLIGLGILARLALALGQQAFGERSRGSDAAPRLGAASSPSGGWAARWLSSRRHG